MVTLMRAAIWPTFVRSKVLTGYCNFLPHRHGLPETCWPRGLATACPGTAHSAEAVSFPVHRAVPGPDRPVYSLHNGAVHKVQRTNQKQWTLVSPTSRDKSLSLLSWQTGSSCFSSMNKSGHLPMSGAGTCSAYRWSPCHGIFHSCTGRDIVKLDLDGD